MEQVTGIGGRARRLYYKNLGAILSLQEQIAAPWLAAHPAPEQTSDVGGAG